LPWRSDRASPAREPGVVVVWSVIAMIPICSP
jgi:hypothetical protein